MIAWKLTYLFVPLFRFSWVIGAKENTQALLMAGNAAADYRPSNAWLARPNMVV
jgi:hypothetical protein